MTIEDIKCDVEILNTSGQDDYQTMIDTWIESGDCYLLIYSFDDPDSLEKVKINYEKISQIKNNQEFSVLIVGINVTWKKAEKK